MSEIITNDLRTLMKETEINNTFDIESVATADKYTLENSWAYLARVQRNTIHFEKYYFPTSRASSESIQYGDLYLDNRYRVCLRVHEDIVKHSARDIFYAERNDHKVSLTSKNISSYYFKYIVEKDSSGNESLILLEPNGYQSDSTTNTFEKIHGNEDYYIGKTVTIRFPMYKNEFSLKDINTYSDIFSRLPLVYVKTGTDRKYLLDEVSFRVDNGDLIIIFPYRTNFLYDRHNGLIQHEVSVIFVDNCEYLTGTTSTNKIKKTSTVDGNTTVYYEVSASTFGLTTFRTDGTYMAFVKFGTNEYESLWVSSVVSDAQKTKLRIDFNANLEQQILSTTAAFTIYLVFAKDMYEYVMKSGNTFVVRSSNRIAENCPPIALINPKEGVNFSSPIPVENTMVVKMITDGSSFNGMYEYTYGVDSEVHYPNMYKITDTNMELGDIYRFFYFYNDTQIGMRYKNRFQYFHRYLRKKLEQSYIEDAINVCYFGDNSVINNLVNESLTRTEFDNMVAVFIKLWNYTPYEYQYDLIDYVKYYTSDEYGAVTSNGEQTYVEHDNELVPISAALGRETPYEYKVDRLEDFIDRNTEALKDYVKIQNKTSEVYYMFAKMINLEKRLRTDTSKEIKCSDTVTFDKPHYIFTFQHNDKTETPVIHIWVDGLLTMHNTIIEENGIYFIYVPADEITEDSYLEIEVRHSYALTDTNLYFPSTNLTDAYTVIIDNPDDVSPTLSDLMFFYYNTSTGIIGDEIDISNFEIFRSRYSYWKKCTYVDDGAILVVEDESYDETATDPAQVRVSTVKKTIPSISVGDYVKIDYKVTVSSLDGSFVKKVDFMPIDVIKIRAKSSDILHKNIALKIRKNSVYQAIHAQSTRYPAINIDSNFDVKFDPDYYQVYRNGRLIPKSMFVVKETDSARKIQAIFEMHKGDSIAFDALPYKTELVYSADEVPEHAIIHLVDDNGEPLLDKPFDIRYYDVYLNGRKLNETQCFGVGDTFLHILNGHSMKHLEIYSRDRDEEYFGWHKHKYTWWFSSDNFRIDEVIDENRDTSLAFVTDDDRHWIIDDIISSFIDDEGLTDYIKTNETDDTEEDNVEDVEYTDLVKCKIFYYEELLPTRLTIATESQFDNEYIRTEYEPIHSTYMIEDSTIAKAANGRRRTLLTESAITVTHLDEDVLYMDPDINVTTASTVFMMGDYDDVCKELETN